MSRSGAHWGRRLAAIVLLVLVAGAVVGDMLVRRAVDNRVATALAPRLGVRPTVSVGGLSATWGLMRDSFPSAHVHASGATVTVAGRSTHVTLDATAKDVSGMVRGSTITARSVAGTATVGWADASTLTGATLTSAGDGKVQASSQITLFGKQMPVTVVARPGLDVATQTLQLLDPSVQVDGMSLSSQIVSKVLPTASSYAKLPTVKGITFTSIGSGSDGATAGFSGTDLSVARR